MGPWLVTLDELTAAGVDRDGIALGCAIDGEVVQQGSTAKLIFPIPRIIARLSEVITLQPGDVVFTGTADGVGFEESRSATCGRARSCGRGSRASAP